MRKGAFLWQCSGICLLELLTVSMESLLCEKGAKREGERNRKWPWLAL